MDKASGFRHEKMDQAREPCRRLRCRKESRV